MEKYFERNVNIGHTFRLTVCWEGWSAGGEGVGLKPTAEVMGLTEDGSKITEQPRGKALKNLECGQNPNSSGELFFLYKKSSFLSNKY